MQVTAELSVVVCNDRMRQHEVLTQAHVSSCQLQRELLNLARGMNQTLVTALFTLLEHLICFVSFMLAFNAEMS